MSLLNREHYLLSMKLRDGKEIDETRVPFCLDIVRQMEEIRFHPKVTFIIGENGTGKSTLLAQLMRQDNQHGVNYVLIDPHGDLAKAMTAELDADHLYWDVGDPNCPLGYNPLSPTSLLPIAPLSHLG